MDLPEHVVYITWKWGRQGDSGGAQMDGFRELKVDFTIHSDPGNFAPRQGMYLMLGHGTISGTTYYFGLQTNVLGRGGLYRGKGLVFSRWDERDLSFVRVAGGEEGWSQSSGHEGDFIGVRRTYDWSEGDYTVHLAPDGVDDDGEWYGVWITDLSTNISTWVGSLKFPFVDGQTSVKPHVYSTLEIYGGGGIRPHNIPEWHVSLERALGDDSKASSGETGYSYFGGNVPNSDIQYDAGDDAVHLRVGGDTKKVGTPEVIVFP